MSIIKKGSKRQKIISDDVLEDIHFESDTGLSLTPPYLRISEKLLVKKLRPSFTEIFSDASRLKKRKLALSDDVLAGGFSFADDNNLSGKRKRMTVGQ